MIGRDDNPDEIQRKNDEYWRARADRLDREHDDCDACELRETLIDIATTRMWEGA